jgi:uncharacterized protein YfaS (alpha-2-macroglobulin family)
MKRRFLLGVLAFLVAVLSLAGAPRDDAWKRVNDALAQRLPQSAIAALEPILAESMKQKDHAEAIKALGLKIALEGQIQGNRPEEKIVRLRAALATVPREMKPVLEAILAHWTWQYFQQNRWRFIQRTQTASAPGTDLQTWDLTQILGEIDRRFTAALADTALLRATPIQTYDVLLAKGGAPDSYRPTLYDFLAYEALEFYQAGEQGAVAAEDAFELDADSPVLADAEAFLAWRPASADPASSALKAVRLFQGLLAFHRNDPDRSAFLDADLARLEFADNSAVGESKSERYQAALRRFADQAADHEVSSRALALLAAHLNRNGDPAAARLVAQRGRDAFPSSFGAALCRNEIALIERKTTSLETESVWNAPWPSLRVTYRNVTQVHFRAVRFDFETHLRQARWEVGGLSAALRDQLIGATPDLSWAAELPATGDFKERTEELPAPSSLAPGFHFILASHDPAFSTTDNVVSVTSVWVSDLALVLQLGQGQRESGGFVLKAGSGEPVAGASVRLWRRNQEGRFVAAKTVQTDETGRFSLSGADQQVIVQATQGGHSVASTQAHYLAGDHEPEREATQTVIFTDRALYRPGQSVHYKGVTLRQNQDAGTYGVAANRSVTLLFNDVNGQEIARAEHRTNGYGSFSGVFTAPRDRLPGQMSLQVVDHPGWATIRVEEYKRPKFQVEIAAPAEAAKLAAPVQVAGKATAYTGAAIGGAKVMWRVERSVRLPPWCWWWQPPATQAIAHGSTVTEPDGSFRLEFTASPDRSIPEKNEPIFAYRVSVDVTDTTGETRSDERRIHAGYTALQATLSAGEWQTPEKPVELTVTTQSLDGDAQAAAGTLTVHALQQPAAVARTPLRRPRFWWNAALSDDPPTDPSNPDSWPLGAVVATRGVTTDVTGATKIGVPLPAGIYRVSLQTKDRFDRPVTARQTVTVIDPHDTRAGIKLAQHLAASAWSVEPGSTFTAVWSTGYETGRAFVELVSQGRVLQSRWTAAGRTQDRIELPVTEAMRGGVSLRVTYVRENRAYFTQRTVEVPWSNKKLSVAWERFRSRLEPGQKETWTAIVTGPDATQAVAEMVATLYDASLDQFQTHRWRDGFHVFRHESDPVRLMFENTQQSFRHLRGQWATHPGTPGWRHRDFPAMLIGAGRGYGLARSARMSMAPGGGAEMAEGMVTLSAFSVAASQDAGLAAKAGGARLGKESGPEEPAQAEETKLDLSRVTARKNLQETAFFFPQLLSDRDGRVRLQFTMPEALTEWKFLGFAHDRDLRSGFLTDRVVTAKDIMVEPNPPRFLREGDTVEFTVKVSNQTDQPQAGQVKLSFADAVTQGPADAALGLGRGEQPFNVPAKQSRTVSWRIKVPDGQGVLTYKAVGGTARASDGEEGYLPVLSRRILVSESLPLPVRGRTTKEFEFTKLLTSAGSTTLRHQALTVQMVSQPAWYAVMALPSLMEYPFDCSEQVFNRLYATALARHIAGSDPKIRRIFDRWQGTAALDSPLEKNPELKSVLLEESPWLRQARSESEARRRVGLLFDSNRLDQETARQLTVLAERQLEEGLWPWFPGGPPSEYISLYIMTGFGRLRHLGIDVDATVAVKALQALDAWMHQRYLVNDRRDAYVPGPTDALYLYGRSFYLKDVAIAPPHREAVDYLRAQAARTWTKVDGRQSLAHLALALHRWGDTTTPAAILASLKERSVTDPELGRFWRDGEEAWWWHRAPIETQAMMIEAFAEITRDAQVVDECQVWLLKQKQTQAWKTTKATADAVYGLLLRGKSLLSSDALVEVSLGGTPIRPENVEPGTGYYEKTFVRDEIRPAMGRVSVRKKDEGVSWGSVHWSYLEDVSKVTPHEGTPLRLKKTLFVAETTSKGRVLKPVTGALAVGDELVVRLELRTDRDMEYVHLKDQRGSGTEPVAVLSRYRYQDGLAYYESTRDTASHFFIDYLRKGTYVFEYSTRVQLKGRYQSGLAEIQCMYAPEFNSHSQSFMLDVK